jgi:competence protein ComEC
MGTTTGLLWCGSYGTGLLLVSLLVRHGGLAPWPGVIIAGMVSLLAGGLAAVMLPRLWPTGPWPRLWLVAGLVGCLAALNYGWRYPTPGPMDVSRILDRGTAAGEQQQVWGWVQDMPQLTRSGKGQFWLKTSQIRSYRGDNTPLTAPEPVRGKLYVTVPAEDLAQVFPGQRVEVRGRLYAPSRPKNPNGFNFQQYLADHRSFAGFSGKWVNLERGSSPPWWGLWRLRLRIAKAQAAGLGTPAGPLVSAMALGRKAVNVPYDLQDAFIQAGLAHTLAASGFHVSLVLGVVLGIMGHPAIAGRWRNPALTQAIVGLIALAGYVVLTGGQPSVLRAALMGAGALVGLALERGVKPLGCLLLAVTLLLLLNPTWIDHIGFRLSVMATLGLIVSVKPLTHGLEWLPPTLATLVAVPVAAYFWTIPLSLYYFNTLTTYSILLNMLVTPLVMVLSLGGIVTGLVSAFSPGLGAMLAWVLWLPAHVLIGLVHWQVALPGSAITTGQIALWQMLGLYGLYLLGWQQSWWRQRRWLVGLLLLLVAMAPIWYRGATLAEATVLAAGDDAVLVVQDQRSSLLINSGRGKTGFYTVAPFLRQAGINRLQSAVDGGHSDGANWAAITAKTPIQILWSMHHQPATAQIQKTQAFTPGQRESVAHQDLEWLKADGTVLKLNLLGGHTWLLATGLGTDAGRALLSHPHLRSEVLWWDGTALAAEVIRAVGPEVAIASAPSIDADTEQRLLKLGIQVFCTERDGAITWNPRRGYRAYLHQNHRQTAALE